MLDGEKTEVWEGTPGQYPEAFGFAQMDTEFKRKGFDEFRSEFNRASRAWFREKKLGWMGHNFLFGWADDYMPVYINIIVIGDSK